MSAWLSWVSHLAARAVLGPPLSGDGRPIGVDALEHVRVIRDPGRQSVTCRNASRLRKRC
jgi:hypothetical protein